MKLNLRTPEGQSAVSPLISAVGLIIALVLVPVTLEHYEAEFKAIFYSSQGLRQITVLAMAAIAGLLGLIGAILGFNSVGHARNPRHGRSWLGFFLGCLTCVIAAGCLMAWMMLRRARD